MLFLMFELGLGFSMRRILKAWRAALAGGVLLTFWLVALRPAREGFRQRGERGGRRFNLTVLCLRITFQQISPSEAILIGVFTSVSSSPGRLQHLHQGTHADPEKEGTNGGVVSGKNSGRAACSESTEERRHRVRQFSEHVERAE